MKRLFFGIIIGIGKIIPGVSGSAIAISLGVYEESINRINNFFKEIKNNIIYLLPLGIGIIISIIFVSKIVINMLDNYYVPTILFFLGLITGGIQDIRKQIRKEFIPITFIAFTSVIIVSQLTPQKDLVINNQAYQIILFILIGFIDAVCMIIPGISGTAVFMMMGCYKMLMTMLSSLTHINSFIDNITFFLPFLLGLTIGIIFTIKLVNILFNKYKTQTYHIIFGLLLSTILYMFLTTFKHEYTLNQIIIGLILSIIGYNIIKKINHEL